MTQDAAQLLRRAQLLPQLELRLLANANITRLAYWPCRL